MLKFLNNPLFLILKSPLAPWFLLGMVALLLSTAWLAYDTGYSNANKTHAANQATLLKQQEVIQAMLAEEIGKMRIENTTIYRKAEREIIKEPIYLDCKHPPSVLQYINGALRSNANSGTKAGLPGDLGRAE
jgi:hypothetical protein